jgi:hypothetical protein
VGVLKDKFDFGFLAFTFIVRLGGLFDGPFPWLHSHELLTLLLVLLKLILILLLLHSLLHGMPIHGYIHLIHGDLRLILLLLVALLRSLLLILLVLLLLEHLLAHLLLALAHHIPQQYGPVIAASRQEVVFVVRESDARHVRGVADVLFVHLALDQGRVFVQAD